MDILTWIILAIGLFVLIRVCDFGAVEYRKPTYLSQLSTMTDN